MQIGKVTLDETYYCGRDLYSDGEIEDEMLTIAQTIPEKNLMKEVERRGSWPILYHFSPLREQVVDWFPINRTMDVLEIGSGCGALTGSLVRRARSVTSVDLSMKRSQINAYRHAWADNLNIYVGNFTEVEQDLDTYDVITLIGVFEYGTSYIPSDQPYQTFLKTIKKHLRPGGTILLAIENRLGLKYWAGCTEDHSGVIFDGLEGYPNGGHARTFSKKELSHLVEEAGLFATWYYPFPDYKFAQSIYSDLYLPRQGDLNRTEFNYDRLRLSLFDESAVAHSLLENDLYPEFANSFLLLLGDAPPRVHPPVGRRRETFDFSYVKFSAERDVSLRIRTELYGRQGIEGPLRVVKRAQRKEAFPHVEGLLEKQEALKAYYESAGFLLNKVLLAQEGMAQLQVVTGTSLEEMVDGLLFGGDIEGARLLLFQYALRILRLHQGEGRFTPTTEFLRIFGEVPLSRELSCKEATNIDLIASNILKTPEGDTVVDYEWTFFFPIPGLFVVYRFLHYYLESEGRRLTLLGAPFSRAQAIELLKEARKSLLQEDGIEDGTFAENLSLENPLLKEKETLDLYLLCGITKEEKEAFAQMEKSFQEWLLGGTVPMNRLYLRISPGKLDMKLFYQEMALRHGPRELKVYFDRGEGFREEDTLSYPMSGEPIQVPIPEGTKRLRLDPGENPGRLSLQELSWDGKDQVCFTSNGVWDHDKIYLFPVADPQIHPEEVPSQVESITVWIIPCPEESGISSQFSLMAREQEKLSQRIEQLEGQLRHRDEEIGLMKGTKVWRLYRLLKRDRTIPTAPHSDLIWHLEEESVSREKVLTLRGWAVDPRGARVRISLQDRKNEFCQVSLSRQARPDVYEALSLETPQIRDDAGFCLAYDTSLSGSSLDLEVLWLTLEGSGGKVSYQVELGKLLRHASPLGRRLALMAKDNLDKDLEILRQKGLSGFLRYISWESGTCREDYPTWLAYHQRTKKELNRLRQALLSENPGKPFFSVVAYLKTYDQMVSLAKTLRSQVYPYWQLLLCHPLSIQAADFKDERIVCCPVSDQTPYPEGINLALSKSQGEMLVFFGIQGTLEMDYLYEISQAAKEHHGDVVFYTDEDTLGEGLLPVMRGDFNHFLLLDTNYIGNCFAVRRSALNVVGSLRSGYGEAALYDLLLRLCFHKEGFCHIPKVLLHSVKRPVDTENEIKALESFYMAETTVGLTVQNGALEGFYESSWQVGNSPLISIIIPSREHAQLLRTLITSIRSKSRYQNYEIIVVDNGSTQPETLALYEDMQALDTRFKVIHYDAPFHYARQNNLALLKAQGKYLLFLNNDMEVLSPDWLEQMLRLCQLPDVGIVGAKLFYPDGTIQHAGLVLGIGGVADHIHRGADGKGAGYLGRLLCVQEVSAVTGACMMIGRSLFESLGGFDEDFPVAFNDVDLCLRVRKAGKAVVFTPRAKLLHYESKSRGAEDTPQKQLRFAQEVRRFQDKWRQVLLEGDPFYSKNLTLEKTDCGLRFQENANEP